MSPWIILLVGVAVGMVLTLVLRRKSVRPLDQSGDTQYIRPHVVAAQIEPPAVSPELERLNQMQLAGTITQTEYDVLRGRLVETQAGAGGLSTLTIVAGTSNKISDIKAVREAVHLGLKDAKDVVDRIPQVIARDRPHAEVEQIQQILQRAGLQTRIS